MPIQAFENPYITIEQAQAIVNILTHQCALIERRNTADRVDFPELYDVQGAGSSLLYRQAAGGRCFGLRSREGAFEAERAHPLLR